MPKVMKNNGEIATLSDNGIVSRNLMPRLPEYNSIYTGGILSVDAFIWVFQVGLTKEEALIRLADPDVAIKEIDKPVRDGYKSPTKISVKGGIVKK